MSHIVAFFVYALEAIFLLGIAGAFMVLILTSIEDIKMLFESERGKEREPVNNPVLGHAPLPRQG